MLPDKARRGQATLISLALYTSIAVVGVGIIISIGMPALENLQDAQAIDNANDLLSDLQEQIETVADSGEGSSVDVGLRFSRGELVFDSEADQVYYRIDTDAQLISPHTSKQFGNLRMSALANVEVRKQRIDGEECWMMENEHIRACVRALPKFIANAIGADTAGFWRFSTGSGQTATDNSSYGNDGTLGTSTGSDGSDPAWVGGKRGNALDFDGTDDFVNVPLSDSLDFSGGSAVTVSAWVNADDWQGADTAGIVDQEDEQAWILREENGIIEFLIQDETGTWHQDCGAAQPPAGEWHHVAGVFNGTALLVYINGSLVAGPATDSDCAIGDHTINGGGTGGLEIGRNSQSSSRVFDGRIDEVRVWNRSLSTAAVKRQYRSDGMLKYIDTRHLLLHYHNKDTGKNLSAQYMVELDTQFEGSFTKNGTGYTDPALTGKNLGRGRVDAQIRTFFGTDYTIAFKLLSGSDFVQVDVLSS